MRTLKLFILFFALGAFCACGATRQVKPGEEDFSKQGREIPRNYPVFLQGDKNSAAFKLNIKYPGNEYNAVLTLNKAAQDAFKVKVLADFGTVVIDADYIEGQMNYKYVLGNMFDQKTLDTFTGLVSLLVTPPSDFIRVSPLPEGQTQINYRKGDAMHRYYFKKGISFPYKMEETKVVLRRKVQFNAYDVYDDISLPAEIVLEDARNLVAVTLSLISVK